MRRRDLIDAESAAAGWRRLIGIGADDFQIGLLAKRNQRVACAFARMLSTWSCPYAEELFGRVDAELQIRRCVDKVIDLRKKAVCRTGFGRQKNERDEYACRPHGRQ